jgi:hypothetical protein
MPSEMKRLSDIARDESGFSIVEVLVAAVILLVGLVGVMTMLDQANATTTSNKAREGATSLQRELVEAARSIPYEELTPQSIVGNIRAMPGFSASSMTPSGWTVVRRGVTYRMTVGVCTVDDSADGTGSHGDGLFCANGAGRTSAATCRSALGSGLGVDGAGTATGATVGDCGIDLDKDGLVDKLTEAQAGVAAPAPTTSPVESNANDYKRVVTLVRWDRGTGPRYSLQSSIVPYPGLSAAPRVTKVEATSPLTAETAFPLTVTDSTRTSIAFAITTRPANAVSWFLDGTPSGTATNSSAGTSWAFTWNLGTVNPSAATPASSEVLDGTYNVGAKAFDQFGSGGPDRWVQVTLNRRIPFAATGLTSARIGDTAQMVWAKPPERDIIGYRVTRTLNGNETTICTTDETVQSCTDPSPPPGETPRYSIKALDRAPDGTTRDGQPAQADISFSGTAPAAPTSLTVTRSTTGATLAWAPSTTIGVTYQVYRDGVSLSDRYGAKTTSTTFTDTDMTAAAHTYYVAAVNATGAESLKTPGVTG